MWTDFLLLSSAHPEVGRPVGCPAGGRAASDVVRALEGAVLMFSDTSGKLAGSACSPSPVWSHATTEHACS
jgi:hypothetical protein